MKLEILFLTFFRRVKLDLKSPISLNKRAVLRQIEALKIVSESLSTHTDTIPNNKLEIS